MGIFITGVGPGFATDRIPFAPAGTCQSIRQARCMEIADYATYNGAIVMFDVMGFGKPFDDIPILLQPGVLSIAWGTSIRQLAAGFGIDIDDITERYEREPAPEAFDIAAGHVPKGSVAAMRFQICGIVDDHPAIVIERVTRLREDLRPDWPQPAQPGGSYRVEITGELSYTVDICVQPQGRPQPRRDRRRGRADRERDPRCGRGAAGNPDHVGSAAGDRTWGLRIRWNTF